MIKNVTLAAVTTALFSKASVAAECTVSNVTQMKNGDRYLWCPGPKSRHIKRVVGAYPHSAFSGGKITEAHVKSVVRGCGITTDVHLFLKENGGPVNTSKPAPTADGKCMMIFKGVGGRRIVLIN